MFVCLYKGNGFIDRAIQLQTRSHYSHASLLFDDGDVIEAIQFVGVHQTTLTVQPGCSVDLYSVNCTPEQEKRAKEYAVKQLGKPYDYRSIVRFLTREDDYDFDQAEWFCSELAFQCCWQAGIHLLQNIKAWAVSPGILSLSPRQMMRYYRTVTGQTPR